MKHRARVMPSGDSLILYNMSKKTDGDVDGEIPLQKMKPQEHFIEAQVQEGDTLQAIALRFYCSVAELKRINQIYKDNEIFSRRTLKVPVTPYSVLTELIPNPSTEPTASTSTEPTASTSSSVPTVPSPINHVVNNTQNEVHKVPNNTSKDDFSIDCNAVVLNSTFTPAVIPYTDAEPIESVSEDSKLLPSKPRDSVDTIIVKQLTSQGADFGIKWFHLVCLILILGVVIPVIYVLSYFEEQHHQNTTITTTTVHSI